MDRNARLAIAKKSFLAALKDIETPEGYFDWKTINDIAKNFAIDLLAEGIPEKTTFDYLIYCATEGIEFEFRNDEGDSNGTGEEAA